MDPQDYGLLKMHALNGAQGQADGARLYAENLRYDYLEGKDFVDAQGIRSIEESGSGRARDLAAPTVGAK